MSKSQSWNISHCGIIRYPLYKGVGAEVDDRATIDTCIGLPRRIPTNKYIYAIWRPLEPITSIVHLVLGENLHGYRKPCCIGGKYACCFQSRPYIHKQMMNVEYMRTVPENTVSTICNILFSRVKDFCRGGLWNWWSWGYSSNKLDGRTDKRTDRQAVVWGSR